ncbi:hypothetical protein AQUCO_01300130v1 [Aquilegia coerulea]|uniref:Rhodanese domain-containing protein n=1 Tax=Aquilegia coerulea TaxID=218851 RepID=A0A2G5DZY5_AQUCA|nr:hypothetical protein AQUCO_01300130v1 [Aquilegia coerulea]
MEAFKAGSLTPVSLLYQRKTESKKVVSLSPIKQSKFSKFKITPSNINVSVILLSSVISSKLARALTYEEAVDQSIENSTSEGGIDVDFGGLMDTVVKFTTENPTVVIGGAAILSVPLVLSQVLKKQKSWGVESAKDAYRKLGQDANAQLLDIRKPKEIREIGSPNIGALRKKAVSIAYEGEDKLGFLKKLSLKFKEPESTTLFILDKFDGNSELVAELVTVNGFKAAYAIKDGAEGTRGWKNSDLPWIPPKRALGLGFGTLADAFASVIEEGSDDLPFSLGVVAATSLLGLLAYTEIETALQLIGSAALVRFVSSKLLYAQDRKETLQQFDEFVDNKVAPRELIDDIKQIGKALLPVSINKKALPAPLEVNADVGVPENSVQNTEAVPELITGEEAISVKEPAPPINSVPKSEVKHESPPRRSRPLSPYPNYPDFKPPASPCPSPP